MKRWHIILASVALMAAPRLSLAADAASWLVQGNQLYRAKDYDKALAAYAQSIKLDRSQAQAYEAVGTCLVAKGDVGNALKYYGWSLQLNPNNAALKAYVARLQGAAAPAIPDLASAGLLYRRGQYDQALDAYQKLAQLHPEDARAFQGMGNAYYGKGQRDAAMTQYRKALELNPSNQALAGFVAAYDRAAGPQAAGGGGGDWFQPAWRSAILPGWGQFYNHEPRKGLLLGGLTLGLLAGELATYLIGDQARQQYLAVNSTGGDFDTPYQTWDSMANLNHIFFISMTAAYVYTLVDAVISARGPVASQAMLSPRRAPMQLFVDADGFKVRAKVLEF